MSGGDIFSQARCLVIKIGSSLLVDQRGHLSNIGISRLTDFVVRILKEGKKVIVVSSGAVAASRSLIPPDLSSKTISLPEKQARSSIGQVYLMEKYRKAFFRRGYWVGQILISKFSINHRASYLNARNTIHELWRMGAVPIINENDPLATEEFRFGENDILGALACGLVDADLYLILSHINGVYKDFSQKNFSNRDKVGGGKLYGEITELSSEFLSNFAPGSSDYGSGGILAKLEAARLAAGFGVPTLIKNGNKAKLYDYILNNPSGTLIRLNAAGRPINARKRWLLSQVSPRGDIRIDAGAVSAIMSGKSLLPGGITDVEGKLEEGDICNVSDGQGKVIARGLSNYSKKDILLIRGLKTQDTSKVLGRLVHAEVIHRDNLVIWEGENRCVP